MILFWRAIWSPIKGFAISLTRSESWPSLFTALIVGRNIFQALVDNSRLKKVLDAAPYFSAEYQFSRQRFPGLQPCSLAPESLQARLRFLDALAGKEFRCRLSRRVIPSHSPVRPQTIDVRQVRAALALDQIWRMHPIQESNQAGKNYIHGAQRRCTLGDQVESARSLSAMPQAQFKVEGADRVGRWLAASWHARSSLTALGTWHPRHFDFRHPAFRAGVCSGAIVAPLRTTF